MVATFKFIYWYSRGALFIRTHCRFAL